MVVLPVPETVRGGGNLRCSVTEGKGTGLRFNQFMDAKLEDWVGPEEVTEIVAEYIIHLEEHFARGTGLTFIGEPGTGKTMLASIVLNAAVDAGYRVNSVEMAGFMNLYKRQFALQPAFAAGDVDAVKDWWRIDKRIEYIRGEYDWVLFDDVGKEYDSSKKSDGWSNTEFSAVLRHRYNRGFPFILTSNYALPQWADRYSPSMESFLYEATEIVIIDSDIDRRKEK